MEVAPFFVDFHHFLSIFTIFYRFSRFTHICRDLHFVAIYALFPQIFFGQNSLLRNITRFCMYANKGGFILLLRTLSHHLKIITEFGYIWPWKGTCLTPLSKQMGLPKLNVEDLSILFYQIVWYWKDSQWESAITNVDSPRKERL